MKDRLFVGIVLCLVFALGTVLGVDFQDVKREIANIQKKVDKLVPLDVAQAKQMLEELRQQQLIEVHAMSQLMQNIITTTDADKFVKLLETTEEQSTKAQAGIKTQLNDLKTVSAKIETKTEEIQQHVEEITRELRILRAADDITRNTASHVVETLARSSRNIHQTVQQGTFGFWSYFLVVQALLLFGYVWWRKRRDDANKAKTVYK